MIRTISQVHGWSAMPGHMISVNERIFCFGKTPEVIGYYPHSALCAANMKLVDVQDVHV